MKKLMIWLLILVMAVLPLSACGDADKNTVPTVPPSATDKPTDQKDPKIDQTDYHTAVKQNFTSLAETSASDFDYESSEAGVTVVSYLGNAHAVRVPERIGSDQVVKIADGAFSDHKDLQVLYLPDSITSIGKGILSGCEGLKALHTPLISANAEGEQFLGYLFGATGYLDNGKVPATLAYIELSGSMKNVGKHAFAECNRLVAVVLGEQITSVDSFAFYGCDSLKYVNLDGLTNLGSYSFAFCKAFVRADFSTKLNVIGLGAFQGCAALSSVTLPFVGGSQTENTYLGYLFGAQKAAFTAGFVPAYLRTVTLLDTCKALGDYAFFECSTLRTVKLPGTLTSIGVRAFEKCEQIEELVLPDTLQTIRENAFFGCTSLKKVVFGKNLKSMGVNAFYQCSALGEITLPASLTALPASAFAGCTALETVQLGGVVKVGKNAFRNCVAIKTVHTTASVDFEEGNSTVEDLLK